MPLLSINGLVIQYLSKAATPNWLVRDFIFSRQGKKRSIDDVIAYLANYFSIEIDDIKTVKGGEKRKIDLAGLL